MRQRERVLSDLGEKEYTARQCVGTSLCRKGACTTSWWNGVGQIRAGNQSSLVWGISVFNEIPLLQRSAAVRRLWTSFHLVWFLGVLGSSRGLSLLEA